MPNSRFIIDNLVDTSEFRHPDTQVTYSVNEDSEYPAENLQKIARSTVFRSANINATQIKGKLDTAVDISALVIGRHNFTDKVTYQLFLYSNDDWTGNEWSSPIYNVTPEQVATDYWKWGEFPWGTAAWNSNKVEDSNKQFYSIILWLDSVYSNAKSYILKLDNTAEVIETTIYCNSDIVFCNSNDVFCNSTVSENPAQEVGIEYYEIGRLYLGEYVEPSYNISYGHSISWDENTTQYRSNAGTLHSDIVTRNKKMEFNLNTIPESDRISLQEDLTKVSLSDDFFISLFPEDSSKQEDYSAIVKFTKVPRLSEFIYGYYKSNYIVEEV